MAQVSVLLAGKLSWGGFGHDQPRNPDGTLRLALASGARVRDLIERLAVPMDQVAMTLVNAQQCGLDEELRGGDRVVLMGRDATPASR